MTFARSGATVLVALGLWSILAAAIGIFYWRGKLQVKRRWHPWIAFGAGGLFVIFVGFITEWRTALIVLWPALLISFLNWRLTQFCNSCGTPVFAHALMKVSLCPKCGARLAGPNSGMRPGG